MDLLNETVLLKTKSTLFNLLIRETSQFLCNERLLNMTYVAYKKAFSRKMQFRSNCYTVVSFQAPFRLSVYKIPAVYLSGAKNVFFCTIRDFGSLENSRIWAKDEVGAPLNRFKPSRYYFTDRSKAVLLLWICCFSVLCLICLCTDLFICALWSPAGKWLISWLSFVVSNCEFVTFPLVSWIRCGT